MSVTGPADGPVGPLAPDPLAKVESEETLRSDDTVVPPEAGKMFKSGTDDLSSAVKSGDTGGGFVALMALVGSLFMWRREIFPVDGPERVAPGMDGRLSDDPEGELEARDALVEREKTLVAREAELKAAIEKIEKSGEEEAKKTLPELQKELGDVVKERAEVAAERSRAVLRESALSIELKRRRAMIDRLNAALDERPHSLASNVELDNGELTVTFRRALEPADVARLESAQKALGALGLSIDVSDDATEVSLSVPAPFWSEWTAPPLAGAGRAARFAFFGWVMGDGTSLGDPGTKVAVEGEKPAVERKTKTEPAPREKTEAELEAEAKEAIDASDKAARALRENFPKWSAELLAETSANAFTPRFYGGGIALDFPATLPYDDISSVVKAAGGATVEVENGTLVVRPPLEGFMSASNRKNRAALWRAADALGMGLLKSSAQSLINAASENGSALRLGPVTADGSGGVSLAIDDPRQYFGYPTNFYLRDLCVLSGLPASSFQSPIHRILEEVDMFGTHYDIRNATPKQMATVLGNLALYPASSRTLAVAPDARGFDMRQRIRLDTTPPTIDLELSRVRFTEKELAEFIRFAPTAKMTLMDGKIVFRGLTVEERGDIDWRINRIKPSMTLPSVSPPDPRASESPEYRSANEREKRLTALSVIALNGGCDPIDGGNGYSWTGRNAAGEPVLVIFRFVLRGPDVVVQVRSGASMPEWSDVDMDAQREFWSAMPPGLNLLGTKFQNVMRGNAVALDEAYDRESLHRRRFTEGARYLHNRACTKFRNENGETVYATVTGRSGVRLFFFFRDGEWKVSRNPNDANPRPLGDEAHITDGRAGYDSYVQLARGLMRYNGDALGALAVSEQEFTLRDRAGKALLLRDFMTTDVQPADRYFQSVTTLSVRYLDVTMFYFYVPANSQTTGLPNEEGWHVSRHWCGPMVPLTAALVDAGYSDHHDVIRSLQLGVNGLTGAPLVNRASEIIEVRNKTEGAETLLRNHAAAREAQGVYSVTRGRAKAYFGQVGVPSRWVWAEDFSGARDGPGTPLTGPFPGTVPAGQEENAKQIAAIAQELDVFNGADAGAIARVTERQRQIRETLTLEDDMHQEAAMALVYALRARGLRGPLPVGASDTMSTTHGVRISAPPIQPSVVAMQWCLESGLSVVPADPRIGVCVDPDSGEIKDAAGNRVWPAEGAAGNWKVLAEGSPLEAIRILASIPSPPANAAFLEDLRDGIRNLALPRSPVAIPPEMRRAQQRNRLARSVSAYFYSRAMNNLLMRMGSAEHAWWRTIREYDIGIIAEASGKSGADRRSMEINKEQLEACMKQYERILREVNFEAPIDSQVEMFLEAEALTTDRSHKELSALYGNVINRLDKTVKALTAVRTVIHSTLDLAGAEWLRRGAEYGGDLLAGEDPEKVLKEALYEVTEDLVKDKIKEKGKAAFSKAFGKVAGKGLDKVLKIKGKIEKVVKVGEGLVDSGTAIYSLVTGEGSVPVVRISEEDVKTLADTKVKADMDAFKKLKEDAESGG